MVGKVGMPFLKKTTQRSIMKKMKQFLKGKKTYLIAVVLGVLWACVQADYLTQDQYNSIQGLLEALGLITLRAAVKKAGIL